MNKVILMGRLVSDPDVRHMQGEDEKAVAKFTLAVDRRVAKNDGQTTTDFISIEAWGKRAELAEKYFHKGTKLVISGRIATGSYTNKDGQKVYTTVVVAEEVEFAESKRNDENGANSKPQEPPVYDPGAGFMNIPDGIDEQLPFAQPTR